MRFEVRVWSVVGEERKLRSAWSGIEETKGEAWAITQIDQLQQAGWVASCEREGVVTLTNAAGEVREIETERMRS